ncbi:hypothetical protein GQ42DRAFT_40735 [Ramicandelaber brevisporus]|nr:hypothetical protein GQ42DRAFT_40735 [Ramicandelaber brevisporus]
MSAATAVGTRQSMAGASSPSPIPHNSSSGSGGAGGAENVIQRFTLDRVGFARLPNAGEQELFLFEHLSALLQRISAASPAALNAARSHLEADLLNIAVLLQPRPTRAIRDNLARCLVTAYGRGAWLDSRGIATTLTNLQSILAGDGKFQATSGQLQSSAASISGSSFLETIGVSPRLHKENRIAALQCIGALFESLAPALGFRILDSAPDIITQVLKIVKSSSENLFLRTEATRCLAQLITAAGASNMTDAQVKDVARVLRGLLTDKQPLLAISTLQALEALVLNTGHLMGPVNASSTTPASDMETLLQALLRMLDTPIVAVRRRVAHLIACVLGATQQVQIQLLNDSAAAAASGSDGSQHDRDVSERDYDGSAPSNSRAASRASSVRPRIQQLQLVSMLRVLSTVFARPTTSRELRVGVAETYDLLFGLLGATFIQVNYPIILRHIILDLASGTRLQQSATAASSSSSSSSNDQTLDTSSPAALDMALSTSHSSNPTAAESVAVRVLCTRILRGSIGKRLGSDQSRTMACQELLVQWIRTPASKTTSTSSAPASTSASASELTPLTETGVLVALAELASLMSELSGHSVSLQDSASAPLMSLLAYPSESIQLGAAWALRVLTLAVPASLPRMVTPLLNMLQKDLANISNSGISMDALRRCIGYAHGVVAVISSVPDRPLAINFEMCEWVVSIATQLLKSAYGSSGTGSTSKFGSSSAAALSPSFGNSGYALAAVRVANVQARVGWLLVGALTRLGPDFCRPHASTWTTLWRDALPRSPAGFVRDACNPHALHVLHSMESALAALHLFLAHCGGPLATVDTGKAVLACLGNALHFVDAAGSAALSVFRDSNATSGAGSLQGTRSSPSPPPTLAHLLLPCSTPFADALLGVKYRLIQCFLALRPVSVYEQLMPSLVRFTLDLIQSPTLTRSLPSVTPWSIEVESGQTSLVAETLRRSSPLADSDVETSNSTVSVGHDGVAPIEIVRDLLAEDAGRIGQTAFCGYDRSVLGSLHYDPFVYLASPTTFSTPMLDSETIDTINSSATVSIGPGSVIHIPRSQPEPRPVRTALVDTAIVFFGRLFAGSLDENRQMAALEEFLGALRAMFATQAAGTDSSSSSSSSSSSRSGGAAAAQAIQKFTSAKRTALQSNIVLAILAALQQFKHSSASSTIGDKTASVTFEVLKLTLSHQSASLRIVTCEALGVLSDQSSSRKFISQVVDHLTVQAIHNRDHLARSGVALALGSIYSHAGTLIASAHLQSVVVLLLSLARDTQPVLHNWALYSLAVAIDAAGVMFDTYKQMTLAGISKLLMSEAHDYPFAFGASDASPGSNDSAGGGSSVTKAMRIAMNTPADDDLDSFDCRQGVGRVLCSLIGAVGPEMQIDTRSRQICIVMMRDLRLDSRPAVVAEYIRCSMQMLVFAHRYLPVDELILTLRGAIRAAAASSSGSIPDAANISSYLSNLGIDINKNGTAAGGPRLSSGPGASLAAAAADATVYPRVADDALVRLASTSCLLQLAKTHESILSSWLSENIALPLLVAYNAHPVSMNSLRSAISLVLDQLLGTLLPSSQSKSMSTTSAHAAAVTKAVTNAGKLVDLAWMIFSAGGSGNSASDASPAEDGTPANVQAGPDGAIQSSHAAFLFVGNEDDATLSDSLASSGDNQLLRRQIRAAVESDAAELFSRTSFGDETKLFVLSCLQKLVHAPSIAASLADIKSRHDQKQRQSAAAGHAGGRSEWDDDDDDDEDNEEADDRFGHRNRGFNPRSDMNDDFSDDGSDSDSASGVANAASNEVQVPPLVTRVSDLIRIAFTAANANSAQLRRGGLNLLRSVIQVFASVEDPDYRGVSILDQYQAQVTSAFVPAMAQDDSVDPDLKAVATHLCADFVASGITQDPVILARVMRPMMAALHGSGTADASGIGLGFAAAAAANNASSSMGSASGNTGVSSGVSGGSGGQTEMIPHASVIVRLSVLSAWARLFLACNTTGDSAMIPGLAMGSPDVMQQPLAYLQTLVIPQLAPICAQWVSALHDAALVSVDADSVALAVESTRDAFGLALGLQASYVRSIKGLLAGYFAREWIPIAAAVARLLSAKHHLMVGAIREAAGLSAFTPSSQHLAELNGNSDSQSGADGCGWFLNLLLGQCVQYLQDVPLSSFSDASSSAANVSSVNGYSLTVSGQQSVSARNQLGADIMAAVECLCTLLRYDGYGHAVLHSPASTLPASSESAGIDGGSGGVYNEIWQSLIRLLSAAADAHNASDATMLHGLVVDAVHTLSAVYGLDAIIAEAISAVPASTNSAAALAGRIGLDIGRIPPDTKFQMLISCLLHVHKLTLPNMHATSRAALAGHASPQRTQQQSQDDGREDAPTSDAVVICDTVNVISQLAIACVQVAVQFSPKEPLPSLMVSDLYSLAIQMLTVGVLVDSGSNKLPPLSRPALLTVLKSVDALLSIDLATALSSLDAQTIDAVLSTINSSCITPFVKGLLAQLKPEVLSKLPANDLRASTATQSPRPLPRLSPIDNAAIGRVTQAISVLTTLLASHSSKAAFSLPTVLIPFVDGLVQCIRCPNKAVSAAALQAVQRLAKSTTAPGWTVTGVKGSSVVDPHGVLLALIGRNALPAIVSAILDLRTYTSTSSKPSSAAAEQAKSSGESVLTSDSLADSLMIADGVAEHTAAFAAKCKLLCQALVDIVDGTISAIPPADTEKVEQTRALLYGVAIPTLVSLLNPTVAAATPISLDDNAGDNEIEVVVRKGIQTRASTAHTLVLTHVLRLGQSAAAFRAVLPNLPGDARQVLEQSIRLHAARSSGGSNFGTSSGDVQLSTASAASKKIELKSNF